VTSSLSWEKRLNYNLIKQYSDHFVAQFSSTDGRQKLEKYIKEKGFPTTA
jgi:hypothetical protein